MGVLQSIDNAREENVGPHGVKADALKAALTRAESALEWLRARHADNGLPLLRLPETRGDLETIRDTARQLADRATDIVILGTGGSSLGGQTLAQLAGFAVPGVGSLRPPPRLHFMDNLDAHTYAELLARLPHATTRFVAISKSGGTAETLMQTIAALSALQGGGPADPHPGSFPGHQRAGKIRQDERTARSARQIPRAHARPRSGRRRPLFGADQCRPVACSDARSRRRRHPRRRGPCACAGACEKTGGRGAGRARRRVVGRAR